MIDAKVHGVQDVRDALRALPGKLRVRALRNALAAGARVVQRAVRSAAPVLQLKTRGARYMYRKGYRKPGTLRKAISVRTSKVARRAGNVGVFVNVRPAKGGQRGARNWRDPFYWRWQKPPFMEAGKSMLQAALHEFNRKLGPIIARLNRPKAPAP